MSSPLSEEDHDNNILPDLDLIQDEDTDGEGGDDDTSDEDQSYSQMMHRPQQPRPLGLKAFLHTSSNHQPSTTTIPSSSSVMPSASFPYSHPRAILPVLSTSSSDVSSRTEHIRGPIVLSLFIDKRVLGTAVMKESQIIEVAEFLSTDTTLRGLLDAFVAEARQQKSRLIVIYPLKGFHPQSFKIVNDLRRLQDVVTLSARSTSDFVKEVGARLLSDHLNEGVTNPLDPRLTSGFGACCALIRHCLKTQGLEDGIAEIKRLHVDSVLRVDPWTLSSLGILSSTLTQSNNTKMGRGTKGKSKRQNLPNQTNRRSREGITLYEILEPYIGTKIGLQFLQERMVAPVVDKTILEARLDVLDLLSDEALDGFRLEFYRITKGLINFKNVLNRLSRTECHQPTTWKLMAKYLLVLYQAIVLVTANPRVLALPICQDLTSAKGPLTNLLTKMQTIDFQQSQMRGRPLFIPSSDQHLESLHAQWRQMDQKLEEIVSQAWDSLTDPSARDIDPAFIYLPATSPSCLYIQTLGSFIVFESAEDMIAADQSVVLPHSEWTFEFEKDGHLFFKTTTLLEFDQQVDAVVRAISEVEARLLCELQAHVTREKNLIADCARVIGLLDLHVGLGSACRELHWVRPQLSEDPLLIIEQGRHPLLEHSMGQHGNTFIPNDIRLGIAGQDGIHRPPMVFLSGPNQSGKSVYLKQIAITTYMAHIGLYVPANTATIGLMDELDLHAGLEDSIYLQRSKFQQSCSVVAQIMKSASKRSLILLDEFGSGTDPASGMALLGAVIHDFASRKVDCPRVIIASHFQELVSMKVITDLPIQMLHMKVESPHNDRNLLRFDDGFRFVYRVIQGFTESSLALLCAKLKGIPDSIIDRATHVLCQFRCGDVIQPLPEGDNESHPSSQPRVLWRRLAREYNQWNLKNEDLSQFQNRLKMILSNGDDNVSETNTTLPIETSNADHLGPDHHLPSSSITPHKLLLESKQANTSPYGQSNDLSVVLFPEMSEHQDTLIDDENSDNSISKSSPEAHQKTQKDQDQITTHQEPHDHTSDSTAIDRPITAWTALGSDMPPFTPGTLGLGTPSEEEEEVIQKGEEICKFEKSSNIAERRHNRIDSLVKRRRLEY